MILGIITLYLREYRKKHTHKHKGLPKKSIKTWTGWEPITEEQSVKFKKEVMINNDGVEENFATIQKTPRARPGR